jgi:hypothetical protein
MKGDIIMKNDYETRALKFARVLASLFFDCYTLEDFKGAIEWYNMTHSRKLNYAYGVSRIAVMRADYVIKFNYAPTERWDNGEGRCLAGDNSTEEKMYQRAVRDGYEYLLAKTTTTVINNRVISIMPRIDHVHDEKRDYSFYLSSDELEWLWENITDLHDGNIGYKNGKPVVIDYGWTTEE